MLLSNAPSLTRVVILVILVFLILNFLLLSQRHATWFPTAAVLGSNNSPHVHECDGILGSDRVVITVKTGATEAQDRIPTQMITSLRCAPNVLIFSDMEQDIGEYHLHDSLDTISPEVRDGNPDFDLYRKQYLLKEAGQTDFSVADDIVDDLKKAAWTLDKYKNTHVVEKAWDLLPNREWYFHIDADTYVFMSSLVHWLRKLNPSKELYVGSMVCTGIPFAHGGSGILVSRAATYNLAVKHNGTAALMDKKAAGLPYGDLVLAHAMKDHGIPTTNAVPIINGETPSTVPFSRDHWCQPVVTVHHISPAEAMRLADFEKKRANRGAPLLYAELYTDFVSKRIPDHVLDEWNAMEVGLEKPVTISPVSSVEECVNACAENSDCFQLSYDGNDCNLNTKSFGFGKERSPEDGKRWQSSWNKTRINAWIAKQKPCGPAQFRFRYDLHCGK